MSRKKSDKLIPENMYLGQSDTQQQVVVHQEVSGYRFFFSTKKDKNLGVINAVSK
jgi:hypothetical protein